MKQAMTIEYCPKCNWLLRAAYMAQEFLMTFETELSAVTLKPSEISGSFKISIEDKNIFDRKQYGGFPKRAEAIGKRCSGARKKPRPYRYQNTP
jgi:selenoprotein W-related protein